MKDFTAKKRLIFVKELERFLRKSANCKNDWAELKTVVNNGYEKLKKLETPELNSTYYTAMIATANELITRTANDTGNAAELTAWLSHEINQLAKIRRQNSYNRFQTTRAAIEEWE